MATARSLYLVVLNLHPRSFRTEFAQEMLLVFDDAAESYGVVWLLGDAACSLVRQRFMRWPDEAQTAASPEQLGLLAGTYPMDRPPHLTAGKLVAAVLLSLVPATGAAIQIFSPAPVPAHHHRVANTAWGPR